MHTERFPDISTDLPLVAEAIDTRERIEGVLGRSIRSSTVGSSRSSTRISPSARMSTPPTSAAGVGSAARLTIYCGRGERSGRRARPIAPSSTCCVGSGASGATVLLGRRRDARRGAGGVPDCFSRNADVPVAIIAVGRSGRPTERPSRALPGVLRAPDRQPRADCRRQARRRAARAAADGHRAATTSRRSGWRCGCTPARPLTSDGGAIYTTLTRQLRRAGGAGVTTLRGSGGSPATSGRSATASRTFASHLPTYTVFVDRPRKIAELWPMVDEITSQARRRHRRARAGLPRAARHRSM